MTWSIVGWVAFVAGLLTSVMLHEAGHFLTARRFGMKATEFFVGFGPKVWSFRRGETEYGVKAIPAGGYVRIVGMTELEPVAPADEPRAFYRQPAPQRAVVLSAGSLVHFGIAIVLFLLVPLAFGEPKQSLRIGDVSPCVPAKTGQKCAPDSPPSPALKAGLRVGDRLVSIDGRRIAEWNQVRQALRAAGPRRVDVVVDRGGQQFTVHPVLLQQEQPKDDGTGTELVPVLGISYTTVLVRSGPVASAGKAATSFWQTFAGTFRGLAAIPAGVPRLIRETAGEERRSVNDPVGPVGLGRVTGEIFANGQPLAYRIGVYLLFMGGLNVFVGIFNLLPLLPLDGGHLAVLVFEKARQAVYRVLRRPDPGRVDLNKLLPLAYVFLILIIGISVLLLAADIVNPVRLYG